MAGKARVHELAKELGVTSKEVLARLSEQGEFVKSASSTVEAPVARRLRESFGGAKPAAEKFKADGNGSPAKAAAPKAAPEKAPAPENRRPRPARGTRGTGGRASRGDSSGAACGTRADPPGSVARRYAWSEARPRAQCAQARRAYPARREQPVLLAAG